MDLQSINGKYRASDVFPVIGESSLTISGLVLLRHASARKEWGKVIAQSDTELMPLVEAIVEKKTGFQSTEAERKLLSAHLMRNGHLEDIIVKDWGMEAFGFISGIRAKE